MSKIYHSLHDVTKEMSISRLGLFALQLLWLTSSAIDVSTPAKKIAKEGSTIQLICSYNLKSNEGQVGNIVWEHSPLGSTAEASRKVYQYIDQKGEVQADAFRGRITKYGHGGNTASIELSKVEENDAGSWRCQVVSTTYQVGHSVINLEVQSLPKISAFYMTPEGSLVVGQSVRMTCDVKATNNIPTVSWYLNGEDYLDAIGPQITIDRLDIKHKGTWWCIARNSVGETKSTNIDLIIEHAPKPVKPSIQQERFLNSNTNLQCRFQTHPALIYSVWYKLLYTEGGAVHWVPVQTNSRIANQTEASSAILHIRSLQSQDLGTYKCDAINKHGTGTCEVSLAAKEDVRPQTSNYLKEDTLSSSGTLTSFVARYSITCIFPLLTRLVSSL